MRLVVFASLLLLPSLSLAEAPPLRLDETSPDAMVTPTRRREHGDLALTWGRDRDGQRVMCADTSGDPRTCYRPGLAPRSVGALGIVGGLVVTGGGVVMFAFGLEDVLGRCGPSGDDCTRRRFSERGQTTMMVGGMVTTVIGAFVMRGGILNSIRYREGQLYIRERHRTMSFAPALGRDHAGLVLGGTF